MPGQQPKQTLVGRTIQSADSSTPVSYKVMEWLRSTSVLDTYLAVHSAVALKIELQVLNSALTAQSDFASRFISQLKVLVALSVPSLVQVYDYGRDGSYFFLVIEHHKSPTLRVKLDTDGRLPLPIALNHARLIAETLSYAAAQGVLHGLLSPDAVTLSSRRGPLLDHFGLTPLLGLFLTRALGDDPKLGGYAAPELFNGQPVSTSSDLYSLTALTYEMATGKLPFPGFSAAQIAAAPIPDPVQIDPALATLSAFIRRGMAKDPAARYLSYTEFNAAIQEILMALEPAAPIPPKAPVAQVSIKPPHAPEPLAKTEAVEEDAGGHTIADLPTFMPSDAEVSSRAPELLAKTEAVEEDVDVGGRTMADMPIVALPPQPRAPEPLAKTEVVEEDAGGRTMADMPIVVPPSQPRAAPPPAPRAPKPTAPAEAVEEDAGGRTMADMPIVRPPEPRAAPPPPARSPAPARAASPPRAPAPAPQPKAAEEDFSGRTMLELPGAAHNAPRIPPSYPPGSANSPPPAYPGAQATVPRQLEQRYRTEPIGDERSAPTPPGGSVPYNFSSMPPTYAGAQRSTPNQLNDRYGTRAMDRAHLEGSEGSSGITGFISTPAAGISTRRRRSPALLIILVLIVLLLIAGTIGFLVLRTLGVIPS
ncbi:MAG: serine/threonine-protein kinase [Aggregatilineales bacterium]